MSFTVPPAPFLVRLDTPLLVAAHSNCPDPANYSEELDDVRSIFVDLCGMLSEIDEVRFVIRGFGATWTATVRTDLAVVLEQLPDVLRGLREKTSVELDFYEQGLQRTVRFDGSEDDLLLTCTSRLPAWAPAQGTSQVSREATIAMFLQLSETFLRVAARACPGITEHRWLIAWRAAVFGGA